MGSCRIPVTCHDTVIWGWSVLITNVLSLTSRSTAANENKSSNDRQLIAIISIQRLEVMGQPSCGPAICIGNHIAVVNIHHIGRLDGRMVKIFVGGVERMVNHKWLIRTGNKDAMGL